MDSGTSKGASRKRKSSDANGDGKDARPTQRMILKWHDYWTKVTMSGFFDEVKNKSVRNDQLEEWLRFRQLLSGRLVLACTRLKKAGLVLPCVDILEEDNDWLNQCASDLGIDSSPQAARLSQVKDIIEYLDKITVLDSDLTAAAVGIWAILFSCWQGWRLLTQRAGSEMDENFGSIAGQLAREEKMEPLLETATLLDNRLTPDKMKAAEDVFCGALQRISEFYEELLFRGWTEETMRCKKCGRFGHVDAKCLFKAKAARPT